MSEKKKSDEIVSDEIKFSKEQILSSKKYMHNRDIVNVVLKSDQSYSLNEVSELIQKFKEKKVK